MIVVDVNLLIYAVNSDSPIHRKAKLWWETVLGGRTTVGLSWVVLLSFVRLTTRAGLFSRPLKPETALDLIDQWLERPTVTILQPGPKHARLLRDLLIPLGTAGNLTSDAHLAALTIERGAELCSTDSDFARFPGLRWTNPLA